MGLYRNSETMVNRLFGVFVHLSLFFTFFYMAYPQLVDAIFFVDNGFYIL